MIGEFLVFDELQIGATLIKVHQLFNFSIRMDAKERTCNPIGNEPISRPVRLQTIQISNWLARPDIDEQFGDGFTDRLTETLLGIDGSDDTEREILELFQAGGFVETEAGNYEQIESVARTAGLLE
jgi:hypothetical protein